MNVTLPTLTDLQPHLKRLAENPDSVVMIAIVSDPVATDFANASWGFFDAEERESLKRALTRCRAKRGADTLNHKEKPATGSISPKTAPSIQ